MPPCFELHRPLTLTKPWDGLPVGASVTPCDVWVERGGYTYQVLLPLSGSAIVSEARLKGVTT